MKLTQILYKQHIGRQTRLFWYIQGKRTLLDTNSEKNLAAKGIQVIDAKDAVTKPELIKFDFSALQHTKPIPLDNTHPDWNDRPCYTYCDNDLLTMGLPQAQHLTKTVVFKDQLPNAVESLTKDVTVDINKLVQRTLETSVIFDAHQELLPKIKDPNRPAVNFPRQYGITDVRKVANLSKKLIQLCECLSGPQLSNTRSIVDNALISFPFEKEFDLYQLKLTMDLALMSSEPLKPAKQLIEKECDEMEFPNLHPVHCSLGLDEQHIYKFENLYPLTSGYHKKNVHTIIVYYDPTKVKHKSELRLQNLESQNLGRALMKAFTASASSARHKFGSDVKDLPEPITVQCIQSDGKKFYFSVFQLNTLNLDGEKGIKNYFWALPALELYQTGGYVEGRPVIDGYSPEVFKRILAFYKNN